MWQKKGQGSSFKRNLLVLLRLLLNINIYKLYESTATKKTKVAVVVGMVIQYLIRLARITKLYY